MNAIGVSVRGGIIALLTLFLSMIAAPAAWADVSVSPSSLTVAVGATATSQVLGAEESVTVSSANTAIATAAYANGIVTVRGVSAGSTVVTVSSGDESASIQVTVTAVSNLRVTPASLTVPVGSTATSVISGALGTVTISSTNIAVAAATLSGTTITVRGVAAGSATISVRDSQKTVSLAVTVTATPSLTVSPTSVSVPVGSNATSTVSGASGTVSVTSANTAIATVSISGTTITVHGVVAGSTTISVRDSLRTVSLAVTVTAISNLAVSPTSVSVPVGSNATSTVSGAVGTVSLTSANTAIATASISGTTITVHGVAAGSTTVSVRDSQKTVSLAVTVTATATLAVSPASVSVPVGSNATSTVSGASGTVSVTSANTAIATASIAGTTITVHGVAAGSTTISVQDSLRTVSLAVTVTATSSLAVSPTSVAVQVGSTATSTVSGAVGTVGVTSLNTSLATVSLSGTTITVTGVAAGSTSVNVTDSQRTVSLGVTVTAGLTRDNGIPVSGPGASFVVLAANDLGMHCTDKDFQIFSILPPFNVVHAQVIQKGLTPSLVTDTGADVYYAAASSATDPAGAFSINTTSSNTSAIFKTNFWQLSGTQTLGSLAYGVLYPAQSCATPPCPSVLNLFSPLQPDVGIPVPDPNALPSLLPHQQTAMSILSASPYSANPYLTNTAQKMQRFDTDLAFFKAFPFGGTMIGVNWFAADGIPMTPVDDAGRANAYPLARVAAVTKGTSPRTAANVLAAVDVVLPVASEADCQTCHAALADAAQSPTPLTGRAADFASITTYANGTVWHIATTADSDVPGPEKLLNAAKINILRLHDAKHGASYLRSDLDSLDACQSGTEASCLEKRRSIQCSQCHYSPALDLAQVGPIDEPFAGRFGRQQTRHISMSSAMHGFHGNLKDSSTGQFVFPDMPAPGTAGRTPTVVAQTLSDTCYACHPGKRTQCLRGAMFTGGVVCQDCHGNMRQVGNDFTSNFPSRPGSVDLAKRVPWANEPKCQSCHIGDAMTVPTLKTTDMIGAADGIRLAQAYTKTAATQPVLVNIETPTSRFAENNSLYRLSKGHGGVMCNACHGSTHSEWPVGTAAANDNVAATQLQGHTGAIAECGVCHTGTLPTDLNGPHGMHKVNDPNFIDGGHANLANSNKNACRACHGQTGLGTVLSRVATARTLLGHALPKGTPVPCNLCHSNQL